ncbi:HAMP domain-containing sensor histidine kinase [Lysinibacillus sp. G4S2]|uniref:sensor histidine kinase n=1 Tax=Lysinibacillus sp. G4S2 TaxID=3055859 RepID=UPI0025A2877A|nr:HAMP domain-containing sensor histidine kinase [Lysinibacillus sp. G4S2]MDM5247270.1 HAMP domain-containing sensor histidine kinase [Lysinibacillus sp. G4S2]
MRKRGIAYKLFLIHILLFTAIFIIQIVFQSIYFEPYYIHKKKQNMEEFAHTLESKIKNNESTDTINKYISEMSESNNAIISVIDDQLQAHYGASLNNNYTQFVVRTKDNKEYNIIDDFLAIDYKELNEEDIISIDGLLLNDKESLILPDKIKIGNRILEPIDASTIFFEGITISDNDMKNEQPKPITIKGKVISKPTESKSFTAQKNVLIQEMVVMTNKNEGQTFPNQIYTVRDTQTDINNLMLIENVEGTDLVILAVTSLQSVDEVIGNLNQYYIILFVFTMIIVIIVAIIFSKTLSKPLVKMSTIANQIANQNFSEKYIVKSKDELGQMGEALNKISTNLEQKITELVHANEKLAQDYELQVKLKEKEKEFVANVSHELKTPLTVINGYIKGIKNGVYEQNDLKYCDVILDEVDRMTEMVQEMLDISRLESPIYQLTESTFDIWHTFLKVYDKFKAMADEKGLQVLFEIEEEAYVNGDIKRIEQVITNLFINAVKYTPKHNRINIKIVYLESLNKYMFKIENENIFIPYDEIEQIWDPFYRVEKSRSKEFGGSGLGLAIVKQILERHNSSFGVNNTENGVEFYFDLRAVSTDYLDY